MAITRYRPRMTASLEMASLMTAARAEGQAETAAISTRKLDPTFLIASLTTILLSGYMVAVG